MKSTLFITTVVLTGLSAGLFYAWQVSVIPGTKRLSDLAYLETMQHINRAILNPWFMAIFLGPIIIGAMSSYKLWQLQQSNEFVFMLITTAVYIIGAFGVTIFGNVPLNDSLDQYSIAGKTTEALKSFRLKYEVKWNRLHLIRTFFSVISFILSVISIYRLDIK